MIGFLGVPGALVELKYRGGLSTSTERPVKTTRTMGGKRKAMIGRRARREWDVSFDVIGSRETHGLVEIARSFGEVMWYPADASAGNLLSPQASGFEVTPVDATDAGLVQLPDGTVARTVVSSSTVRLGRAHGAYEMVPVRPGQSVSVGMWVLGSGRFAGFWRDATGVSVTNFATPTTSFTGWTWHTETLTPPTGAVFLDLHLRDGTQYARPVVSWGSRAVDRPGRGCPKAIAYGPSESLSVIADDDAYGSVSVTITEVG